MNKNNVDFVGMNTGGFNVRATRKTQNVEPQRARGNVPSEEELRERVRQELERERAMIKEKIRAEIEAEMESAKKATNPGLAKASPNFKPIEPSSKASEQDLDNAIDQNSDEVED